jgi:hypothetical protein
VSADAYDSAAPRGTGPVFTRVYRRRGGVAHLRDEQAGLILCPAWRYTEGGWEESWLGTGSQDEYEKAASLRLCLRCFAIREAAQAGIGEDASDRSERDREVP